MMVDKLYATIQSVRGRARLAWMVFREGPDEVVTLTESGDGSVEFRHRFGVGIAANHRTALEGIARQYGLFLGQRGLTDTEDDGHEA